MAMHTEGLGVDACFGETNDPNEIFGETCWFLHLKIYCWFLL